MFTKMFVLFVLLFFFCSLNAVELPKESVLIDATDKANVENYRARSSARNLILEWNSVRERVNIALKDLKKNISPLLLIEWGGGYSGNYHCYIIFQDASAIVVYTFENKISFIQIREGNEELKKCNKYINEVAEALASRNGNLGFSGNDKEYYFVTFYFKNPWSNSYSYNSFAFEYSMFLKDRLVGYIPRTLYSAYKEQLKNEKVIKNENELADEVKKAFGFIIKQ